MRLFSEMGSPSFWPAVLAALLAVLTVAVPVAANVPARAPDRVLTGRITDSDHQTYKLVPFQLPEGTERLVVAFDHSGKEERTVIDLGMFDAERFRGASGGNKPSFTIGATDATPSYLPGRLQPGTWKLALSVPNIRKGNSATWQARLWFMKEGERLPADVAGRGAGWYRGDFHLHSGHSDGSCASQSGKRVPCPLYKTLEKAAERGLDFVAVTEHNTTSHHAGLREAQAFFDRMLIIPGREITTFRGHMNIFGVEEFVDFRVAGDQEVSFGAIADRVHQLGGILSINHPALPSGEQCMGCGWTMPDVDYGKADAVEVINGGAVAGAQGRVETPVSGIPFWLQHHDGSLTAIGGGDNHDATQGTDHPQGIGRLVTVVYAEDLTIPAILAGVKSGRVFIDIEGEGSRRLDYRAQAGGEAAHMGGSLRAPGGRLRLVFDLSAPAGSRLELLDRGSGRMLHQIALGGEAQQPEAGLELQPGRHQLWAQVRSADGRLILLGNAITVDVPR